MIAVIELRIIATDITIWRPPTAGHQINLRRVDGDALQPRIERTITAKVSKRPVGFYKRLLSDILCLVSVVHESHDQTKDLVLILQHQQIEGTLVATLHSLDQLLIIFLG